MTASEDSPATNASQRRARPLAGGGGEAAASGSAVFQKEMASSGPSSSTTVLDGVTVADARALDCLVCCLPLKPPIFQCKAGHMVCSSCHENFKANGMCHICGVANGGYIRCHAMERVVEAIRYQCPNAAHGCTTWLAYYDKESHRQTCLHVLYRCPCVDCNFFGLTRALLDHFEDFHGWHCITKVRTGEMYNLYLEDGLNTILPEKELGSTARRPCLLLLDVARQPLGCTICVLLIHPHATNEFQGPCSMKMKCELTYSWSLSLSCGDQVEHNQKSEFMVTCTDLSSGLPNPDEHFQFAVPHSVLASDDKEGFIKVGFRIANNL